MEEEARDILRNAVKDEDKRAAGIGSEIASLFSKKGLDFQIVELRGSTIKPPAFDK